MKLPIPENPRPVFCPYCGEERLKFVGGVPRCMGTCRSVFHVIYSRKARRSPRKKENEWKCANRLAQASASQS